MTYYRTRTYIAADWTNDIDAVEQLRKWNDSDYWSLSFTDAHDLKQARDGSLNCTIKNSLRDRLNASKTFVLIVGDQTKNLRSGSCIYCPYYHYYSCDKRYNVDYRSYIEFECDKAISDGLKIVVLYNSTRVDKTKCPEVIQKYGIHVAMKEYKYGHVYWDYAAVRDAIMD